MTPKCPDCKRDQDDCCCKDEIESLRQQLASTEANQANIEATHRITLRDVQRETMRVQTENDTLRQQLVAANVLIAEQNKLAKERQEWALHTNEVISSLNQQLAEALEQNLVLSKQTDHTILDLSNYVDSLEQQLAGALAACKLKDEALEHIALIDLGRDTLPTDFCMNVLSVRKALTIQPDNSALKAWLGEPIGEVKKHTGSLKDMAIIVWSGEQPEEGAQLYIKPKGLK